MRRRLLSAVLVLVVGTPVHAQMLFWDLSPDHLDTAQSYRYQVSVDGAATTTLAATCRTVGVLLTCSASLPSSVAAGSHVFSVTYTVPSTGLTSPAGAATLIVGSGGPVISPSPDRTEVPPANWITNQTGAVWTISATSSILKDGRSAGGGVGVKLFWLASTVYTMSASGNWYQWTDPTWTLIGPVKPGDSATPPPTDLCITSTLTASVASNRWPNRAPDRAQRFDYVPKGPNNLTEFTVRFGLPGVVTFTMKDDRGCVFELRKP